MLSLRTTKVLRKIRSTSLLMTWLTCTEKLFSLLLPSRVSIWFQPRLVLLNRKWLILLISSQPAGILEMTRKPLATSSRSKPSQSMTINALSPTGKKTTPNTLVSSRQRLSLRLKNKLSLLTTLTGLTILTRCQSGYKKPHVLAIPRLLPALHSSVSVFQARLLIKAKITVLAASDGW